MRHVLSVILAGALAQGACLPANAERVGKRSFTTESGKTLVVETFVDGLEVPWSMAFTSPTRLLVTERPGRVRVVSNGRLELKPLAVLTDVEARSESGLMGIALAPDYSTSRLLYLSYAYDSPDGPRVRIVRFRDDGDRLSGRTLILEGIPAAQYHAGCRLRFGPDGKLYVTTGDATTGKIAQDLRSLGGKTLRLNPDGSIPADNPFPGSPVFSLGHRNSQGLDWDPRSGLQFQTEHGPSGFDGPGGGDEVNIVEAGKNYGWPLVHHRESRERIRFAPAGVHARPRPGRRLLLRVRAPAVVPGRLFLRYVARGTPDARAARPERPSPGRRRPRRCYRTFSAGCGTSYRARTAPCTSPPATATAAGARNRGTIASCRVVESSPLH